MVTDDPGIKALFDQRSRKASVTIWDEDRKQSRREVIQAPWVSVGEDLLTVLDSELAGPVTSMLDTLATLVTMTDANRSVRSDGAGKTDPRDPRPIPSFRSNWAGTRLSQAARRISEEAEAIAAWVHRPHDPKLRRGACADCGGPTPKEAKHCPDCGAPTLRAFRREHGSAA